MSWAAQSGRYDGMEYRRCVASRPGQISENLKALKRIDFSDVELEKIETILKS